MTSLEPTATEGIDRHGVVRNSAYGFAVQLAGAVLTAATTIFLVRVLGPGSYGVYALATSVGALLGLPADLGISASAARYAAERADDRGAVAAVLGDAFRLKLVIAGSVALALALAAAPIADAYDTPGLVWPLRMAALAMFFESFTMLTGGTFVALGRIHYNVRLLPLGIVTLGVTVALVLAGGGVTGATAGRAIGYAMGALASGWLLWRLLARGLRPRLRGGSATRRRQIAAYAGPLVIIDGAFALFSQLDILLIGAILGSTAAGLFQAPLRLVTFLHYPGYAIASGVAPRLANLDGSGSAERAFVASIRLTVLIHGGLAAALVPWAEPIVDLVLGPDYGDSVDVLRAFAPFVLLSGVAPLLALGANYLGEAWRRLPVALAALVINLIIDLALISTVGIVAGAIGSTVAYALYVPAHFWICRRRLGFAVRPLLLTLARSLLAGAAMAGVLALFGTTELSAASWILGSLAGAAVYLGALLALREIRLAEIAAVLAWARRARR